MCHLSNAFQKLNSHRAFINKAQKGFMRIPNGGGEHGAIINEIILHVEREKKSLYMMTIDLEDAFGRVPHRLIKEVLSNKGFDDQIINCIFSSYKNSVTRIIVPRHGKSDIIRFNRGVKQGCPLSPTLFNISIDPLIEKLNQMVEC